MKLNAAMLMAALMLSGTVLAQSSGPSAGGQEGGQGATAATTGQAPASTRKTGDSGPAVEQAGRPAKPGTGTASNTIGVNRGPKTNRGGEHYP